MIDDAQQLYELEESLWRAETRFDQSYMDKVLAPDFFEFGRSGKTYSRQECLTAAPQKIDATLPLKNFKMHALDAANALVTYVSEVKYDEMERANRSSLWTKTSDGWKLRFHQGTPIP